MKSIIIILVHLCCFTITVYSSVKPFYCKNVYFMWTDEVGLETKMTCAFGNMDGGKFKFFINKIRKYSQESRDDIQAFWIHDIKGMDATKVLLENSNEHFKNVEDLRIENTDLANINRDITSGLYKIRRFYLGRNKITHITPDAFDTLQDLRILSLNNNLISHLDDLTFNRLKELKKISLSFNKLTEISNELFANNRNLQEIYLHGNQLRVIGDNAFENIRALQTIDLRENYCISSSTFPDGHHIFDVLRKVRNNCRKSISENEI